MNLDFDVYADQFDDGIGKSVIGIKDPSGLSKVGVQSSDAGAPKGGPDSYIPVKT